MLFKAKPAAGPLHLPGAGEDVPCTAADAGLGGGCWTLRSAFPTPHSIGAAGIVPCGPVAAQRRRSGSRPELDKLKAESIVRYAAFADAAQAIDCLPAPAVGVALTAMRKLLAELWRNIKVANIHGEVF